jgi:Tol biopolymer transport system component
MQARGLLTVIASLGLGACSTERTEMAASPYRAANYLPAGYGSDRDALKLFPSEGTAVTITLPFRLSGVMFAADGKSVYGVNTSGENGIYQNLPGLSRIGFNPTRIAPVPGTAPFLITTFAVSAREDKLVISGSRSGPDAGGCGVFEIALPAGNVRQVLKSDCSWDMLSLSPDGVQAIARVGSNTDHDLRLELIDLIRGTTKSLASGFWIGVWSPDGKWIAALGNGDHKIFLMDAHDLSKRRLLGTTAIRQPEWSPDSRYLLLRKYALFKCGFYIDIDPPATLEMLDIRTGKRSTIRSSDCQLQFGSTGWVSKEIAK